MSRHLLPILALCLLGTACENAPDLAPPIEESDSVQRSVLRDRTSSAERDALRLTLDQLGLDPVHISAPPRRDRGAWYFKVDAVDAQGALRTLAVGKDGTVLTPNDIDAMHAEHEAMLRERRGTLDTQSIDRLADLDHLQEVELWLFPALDDLEPPPVGDGPAAEKAWAAYHGALRHSKAEAWQQLVAGMPSHIKVLGREGRAVRVLVAPKEALSVSKLDNVVSTMLAEHHMPDTGPEAADDDDETIGFDHVRSGPWFADGNGNGTRIRIGVRESGGGANERVVIDAPNRTLATFNGPATCCNDSSPCGGNTCLPSPYGECAGSVGVCTKTAGHAKTVLDLIAEVKPDGNEVGVPDAHIHYSNASWTSSLAWFETQNVHVANHSQAASAVFAVDEAVRNDRIAVFDSAGNGGEALEPTCDSPSLICVSTANVANNGLGNDPQTSNFAGTDREQPDLSTIGGATSWASARASAVGASLLDLSKTQAGMTYTTWDQYPTATKALLMAASTTNLIDGSTSLPGNFGLGDGDERDGAGSINMVDMREMFDGGQWSIRLISRSNPTLVDWSSVYLTAGETIRGYTAWTRCPSGNIEDNSADFGLRLFAPSGAMVAGSSSAADDSYDQTYEHILYTAPTSGTYQFKLHRWSQAECTGQPFSNSTYVGLGYHID